MITIQQAKDPNAKHLKKFSKASINNQVKAAKYIEQVAAQAGLDLTDVDVGKMFKSTKKGQIITSKRLINKTIFEHMEEVRANQISSDMSVAALVFAEKEIKAKLNRPNTRKKNVILNHMKQLESKADRLRKSGETVPQWVASQLRNYHIDLKYLEENGPDNTFKSIVKVVRAGFWKYCKIEKGCIVFITAKPIILSYVKPQAGLNLHKNMGRYRAVLSLSDFSLTIRPYKGNTSAHGHIHPYVGSSNRICWGNTEEFASNATEDRNMVDLMAVTAHVLSKYSPAGTPYTQLQHFVNGGTRLKDLVSYNDYDERIKELLEISENKEEETVVNNMADYLDPYDSSEDEEEEGYEDDWDEDDQYD